MQRLFLFLYKYRAFLTFLLLEAVAIWLIVENNNYQSAKFFNSSNQVTGNLIASSRGVKDYFNLADVNSTLSDENARLKKQLQQYKLSLYDLNVRQINDDALLNKYDYISAKVIKNSTRRVQNYITIDKGIKHGLEEGMAIIGGDGIVGKVKSASENYSVIVSVLHTSFLISSKLKRTGDLCTTHWNGKEYTTANLEYLPRHVELVEGDTIVTSGYNAIFPEGIMIGVVDSYSIREDAPFYDIDVRLSTDYNNLAFVYAVKNNLIVEQDSIENLVIN